MNQEKLMIKIKEAIINFKYFLQNINKKSLKAIGTILFWVLLPIIALRLLGFLQPLEWAAYDFLFYLSPSEPGDERIVLVGWNEADIQMNEEDTMSDRTLGFVIDKIKEQQPRLIGFDLYRDVPVPSRLLSKAENDAAYEKLQSIFRFTPNLIGIEKVREPIIKTSTVLKETKRVASSDIILDSDGFVRRSYIDPQPALDPNNPATVKRAIYIGTALGGEYLAQEGWKLKSIGKGSLMFDKDKQKIILEQLKAFDGGYINNQHGLDFLINWRRGSNPFFQVSVADLIADSIPKDIFRDKIVIIGNSASSTADRYNLPLKRWSKDFPQWTYGLEIPAHVASSIISAAKDGRPLMRVVPKSIGYWLLGIVSFLVSVATLKYSHLPLHRCLLITTFFCFSKTFLLLFLSYCAFQAGYWIPIVPSILGVWGTCLLSHNYIQFAKEQKNTDSLKLLTTYLTHKLNNVSNSIDSHAREIQEPLQPIHDYFLDQFLTDRQSGYANEAELFEDTFEGQNVLDIKKLSETILIKNKIISRYVTRTQQYLQPAQLRKNHSQISSVNPSVQQVVKRVKEEKQLEYKCSILVRESYDPALKGFKVDRLTINAVLENLLENAINALVDRLNENPQNYRPTIWIQTRKKHNFVNITVKDNGVGIPTHFQHKIFESFVTSNNIRGQGIGLAIVSEFLRLDRGKITLESQLGQGSIFTVSLQKKHQIEKNRASEDFY